MYDVCPLSLTGGYPADINIWYRQIKYMLERLDCIIRISSASQDMTRLVTKFCKFKYNRIPIGMYASKDIFQVKVDDVLDDIKGVKTYIDYILFFCKEILSKHIEQLRIIFGRLRTTGLKVNDPKWTFGLKYIPYLGYVITWEVIKPDPNKLQGIMDIRRPTTMNEAWVLIGVVRCYRLCVPGGGTCIISPDIGS